MKKTFETTIVSDGAMSFIPLPFGQRVQVTLELDTAPREVAPPDDLVQALQAAPPAWQRWQELSFTHQREWAEAVEGAKKPETRAKRIANAVDAVSKRPPKKG